MLTKSKIPSHFSVIKSGNETIFVKKGYDEIVKNIVFNNRFSVNRQATNIDIKSGRGYYLSIPITKDSTEKIIIRDYKHGGLFGKLFGNVFFNFKRPLNEISISEFALQRGIPSAEVIAVTQKRIFGIFYKATFISKEIKGAIDILQFLKETPLEYIQKSKKSVIFALVRLIRNMHDAGIYHADLHLKNILLRKNLNGEFQAYIIDLDKSVIFNKLSINQRIKNLLRLNRSFEKLRWFSGETIMYQRNTEDSGNYSSPIPLSQGGRAGGIMENGVSDKKYQFNGPVSQSDTSGEGTKHKSMNQKIKLISVTDKIGFFKSYMLYNHAIDKDWKRYIRQYHSHHALHRFWWRVLGS